MLSKRQQKLLQKVQEKHAQRYKPNQTPLREKERYYRSNNPPPDISTVLSFKVSSRESKCLGRKSCFGCPVELKQEITAFEPLPGLLIIPNSVCPQCQRRFIQRAIEDYSCHPNRTSLDVEYDLPKEGLWKAMQSNAELTIKRTNVYEEHESHVKASSAFEKLRWVTLGYQYDWASQTYPEHFNPFPQDLTEMTLEVIDTINCPEYEYPAERYRCEAGIVNYYHQGDRMTSHVDKSERNMQAPLVSFSLGASCIFLIGGQDREKEPIALFLNSGDVLVMRGESRTAFHGVPRILKDSVPEHLCDPSWAPFSDFISKGVRVNINVRQVEE